MVSPGTFLSAQSSLKLWESIAEQRLDHDDRMLQHYARNYMPAVTGHATADDDGIPMVITSMDASFHSAKMIRDGEVKVRRRVLFHKPPPRQPSSACRQLHAPSRRLLAARLPPACRALAARLPPACRPLAASRCQLDSILLCMPFPSTAPVHSRTCASPAAAPTSTGRTARYNHRVRD
jgi:hypothetical protein